jgi:adenosylhomocysteine nucleosidase
VLGFVTGLAAEARLLRNLPVLTGIGGGAPEGAARAARCLAGKVQGLISFGLAGGLDPALPPGAIIIPREILSGTTRYACDDGLSTKLGGFTHSRLLAGTGIAASVKVKSLLRAESQAVALDLESGAVAAVAAEHGLPFAVLRAIADPAERALPEAALLALDAKGAIAVPAVIRSLLRNPAQLPQLVRLARDAAAARQALVARLKLPPFNAPEC